MFITIFKPLNSTFIQVFQEFQKPLISDVAIFHSFLHFMPQFSTCLATVLPTVWACFSPLMALFGSFFKLHLKGKAKS